MHYEKKILDLGTENLYSIDTNGTVVNETSGKILRGTKITKANRYVKIILNRRYLLHRLVAENFVPNPLGLTQVNHKNGNRAINKADNLEWVTPAQNVKHAYKTGLKTNAGENNPISVLTEEIVTAIWQLAKQGHKPSAIIRLLKLNVCRGTVSSVTNGKNWTHITSTLGV
jgi:hypothetical protein